MSSPTVFNYSSYFQAKESIDQLVYVCRTDKEEVREAAKQTLLLLGEAALHHRARVPSYVCECFDRGCCCRRRGEDGLQTRGDVPGQHSPVLHSRKHGQHRVLTGILTPSPEVQVDDRRHGNLGEALIEERPQQKRHCYEEDKCK